MNEQTLYKQSLSACAHYTPADYTPHTLAIQAIAMMEENMRESTAYAFYRDIILPLCGVK